MEGTSVKMTSVRKGITRRVSISPNSLRELVAWLAKDVVSAGPEVTWEAVIGHNEVDFSTLPRTHFSQAKQSLHDCVTLPMSFPNIFASLRHTRMFSNSVSSLLLFGPPGTGKTMLAKVGLSKSSNLRFLSRQCQRDSRRLFLMCVAPLWPASGAGTVKS